MEQYLSLVILIVLDSVWVDFELPISRNDIYDRLQNVVRQYPSYSDYIYDHHKPLKDQKNIIKVVQEIGNESAAIKRAEILLKAHQGLPELLANPSTKVHLLVKEIREWIHYFNYNPA